MAESGNTTNVVEAVAKACKKYDIGLGLYYSLWDRKENGNNYINGDRHPHQYFEDEQLDLAYNTYMINQLNELMDITESFTPIVEFWFDGGWTYSCQRGNQIWLVECGRSSHERNSRYCPRTIL